VFDPATAEILIQVDEVRQALQVGADQALLGGVQGGLGGQYGQVAGCPVLVEQLRQIEPPLLRLHVAL